MSKLGLADPIRFHSHPSCFSACRKRTPGCEKAKGFGWWERWAGRRASLFIHNQAACRRYSHRVNSHPSGFSACGRDFSGGKKGKGFGQPALKVGNVGLGGANQGPFTSELLLSLQKEILKSVKRGRVLAAQSSRLGLGGVHQGPFTPKVLPKVLLSLQ